VETVIDAPISPSVDSLDDANPPLRRPCTYEELGLEAFGNAGRLAVLISKALYAGGCLVAYVVVVRDNFGLALRRMAIGPTASDSTSEYGGLYDDDLLAFGVSAIFMLPLSCPRLMKPMAKFSFVSILSIVFLMMAVVYLYFSCANPEGGGGDETSFYENWIEVRSFSGLVESLGCFVFTFVCHHTVNLAYESLPPQVRNPRIWRRVSTNSIALALQASLAIGVFSYLTFGSMTPADVVSRSCVHLCINFIEAKSY
jgi:amino acid permease